MTSRRRERWWHTPGNALVALVAIGAGVQRDEPLLLAFGILFLLSLVAILLLRRDGSGRAGVLLLALLCVLGGIGFVLSGYERALSDGGFGMMLPGGIGIFTVGVGLWLFFRAQIKPLLGTSYLSEQRVTEVLAAAHSTGTSLRRVDRLFAGTKTDMTALDRALHDGECLAVPTPAEELIPDPWDPDRPSGTPTPDSQARRAVWPVDGRPTLVVVWWSDESYSRLHAAAYAWDDAAACTGALDELGERLGWVWEGKATTEVSRPWGIGALFSRRSDPR